MKVTYKNTPKAKDGKDGRGRFMKVWEHLMEEGVFQLGLDRLLRWDRNGGRLGKSNKGKQNEAPAQHLTALWYL